MSEPFVVHLPKTRTLVVAVVNVALTTWPLYLVGGGSRLSGQWTSRES
jgi:FAD/FMN-containing dehydrogenase